jgi:hypothetical protein
MAENRKIAGFKKFSDIKGKPGIEEVNLNSRPETDSDLPANPNTPEVADRHSIEKPISRKGVQPFEQDINLSSDDEGFDAKIEEEDAKNETKVETIGRIAKFPKNVNASKAYNFLENVKVSKKSIWYIMIEKQDHELQMVKYNYKEGVDLGKFVNELKTYYTKKYAGDAKMCEMIESINVDGNDKYSMIKNIPLVKVDGRKMIAVITEDLIKLLSK